MKNLRRCAIVVLGLVAAITTLSISTVFADTSVVDTTDAKYSYADLTADAKALAKKYSDRCRLSSLGKSWDGRNIWCLRIGSDNASRQIVVFACVHAREYINGPVAMAMAEEYCKNYTTKKVNGRTYKDIFSHTQLYIVPMVNPDGVMIAQEGLDSIRDKSLREKAETYPVSGGYYNWKANARGVDINRNFESGFNDTTNKNTVRSSERYGGTEPYTEKETMAMVNLVKELNCQAVINLHTMGQVYYWGYTDQTKEAEERLVKIVSEETGYTGQLETGNGDGDAEHYFRNITHTPYMCIENATGGYPNDHSQFTSIYEKNVNIPVRTADAFRGEIVKKTDTSSETSGESDATAKQKLKSAMSLELLPPWIALVIAVAFAASYLIWTRIIDRPGRHDAPGKRGSRRRPAPRSTRPEPSLRTGKSAPDERRKPDRRSVRPERDRNRGKKS